MAHLTVAHTAQLEPAVLESARLMVQAAFVQDRAGSVQGSFTDEDWDHALGGMHALVHERGELVGHGSVVQRRFLHAGRSWRVGYVEAVAVAARARRRGHGAAVMAALEQVIRGAYDFGALSATDDGAPLYRSRGWRVWSGPASVLAPSGPLRTPDEDGAVHVLPLRADLDLAAELTCDWRDGDLW
ncbi:GNAT family N-acetyltransferase [Geodermatophilus sp. SYSU D00691]